MRSSRNTSVGRATKIPAATVPIIPSPRPVMSICMVRLRGNAESRGAGSDGSSASRRGGSSTRRNSSLDSASLARIAASAASSVVFMESILIRGQQSLEEHSIFEPFTAHGGEKPRSRAGDSGKIYRRRNGQSQETAGHPGDGADPMRRVPGIGDHREAAHEQSK